MTAKSLSFVSRMPETRCWTTSVPSIAIGMISRPTMKALVRTAAVYSREAMTNSLRMAVALRFRGRDADEDVVQRRPGQLEVTHRAALHQSRQDHLRVGAAVEPHLLPAAEVRHLDHP